MLASNLGMNLEYLETDKNSILAGGSYLIKDAMVNGRKIDLHHVRYALITEGPKAFYIVEVSYSPEIDASFEVWKELQNMISSFRVLP
jgi:hypothetical protein